MEPQFLLQDKQYRFPYHWLPQHESDGSFSYGRSLHWGLEYLTYMHAVRTAISKLAPQNILDVGCGDGRLQQYLQQVWQGQYTGIDLSHDAITLAQVLNQSKDFQIQDLSNLKENFDAVVLLEVLEHIPDSQIPVFLNQVAYKLTPSGKVVVCVPGVHNQPMPAKHYRHYTLEDLTVQLHNANLQICDFYYLYQKSFWTTLIGKICHNRFFTLNPSFLTRWLWQLHQMTGYHAQAGNAGHILVVAQKSRILQ